MAIILIITIQANYFTKYFIFLDGRKKFRYNNITALYNKIMTHNNEQIETYVKEVIEQFQNMYVADKKQKIDCFVLIDTNYKSRNISHSSGYMSISDNLLVLYLKLDLQKISNLSAGLVKFIIMHELCHSISKQIHEDNRYYVESQMNNIKTNGANNIIPLWNPNNQNDYQELATLIEKINKLLNGENVHKCIDLCAKEILGLNNKDFIENLDELYKISKANKDMACRRDAAKEENYKNCIKTW